MDRLLVGICEDTAGDEDRLKSLIEASPITTRVALYTNPADFLQDFTPGVFDLLFMDIYMRKSDGTEEPDGVEIVRAVRAVDPHVPIAFTTTSEEFALEGYRLGVSRYLEKPVRQDQVEDALRMALADKQTQPGVTLRLPGGDIRVPKRQIVYAEQSGHNLMVHLIDGRTVTTRMQMGALLDELGSDLFVRCHKSYVANLDFVEGVDESLRVLKMRGGDMVHVRRADMVRTRKAWEARMFELAQTRSAVR